MNTYEPNTPVHVTSLFDPKIGYLYSFDLFEKDLYLTRILDQKNQAENKSGLSLKNLANKNLTT